MFINVGAMFAPFAAMGIRDWWLKHNGFLYDANLPALCHQQLSGTISVQGSENLARLSTEVSGGVAFENLSTFAGTYLNVFTQGFHYAFIVAILAMGLSTVIYLVNRKGYPDPKDKMAKSAQSAVSDMPLAEVRQRIWALMAVFGIVIFFWFSFNQSGLMLTYFAKDYTILSFGNWQIGAELLQSVNPIMVVLLTPIIMGVYGWLRARNMEPSTPKKIAIGMGIAALAFLLLAVVSKIAGLPDYQTMMTEHGGVSPVKVTPFVLIGTFFILTVAELFISPLGISFVSKVAPPHLQGMMQGGWLTATGIGNLLMIVGAVFYELIPIWAAWSIFVVACTLSMLTMLFMLKWLERIAK
jgi:POT family proton-dependent oligopeptide transporter